MAKAANNRALLPESGKERLELVKRAQAGDESTAPAIRELLEDREKVELCGNLARMAEQSLVSKISGKSVLAREGFTRKLQNMRQDLCGPQPSPIEALLVDRVVACWLHLHQLECVYAQNDGMALGVALYYQKSITQAHRRYLSAIKTLATVRRLALPVLQVNVAENQQINMAAPAADRPSG